MQELISTFHIDVSLLVAQIINFVFVFVILYFIAVKPLHKAMESRQETITQGLSDAKEHHKLLAETELHYKAALQEARKEAGVIIDNAKKNAVDESARIIKDAEIHALRITEGAKTLLDQEKQKMLASAKNELAGMVVSATEKVLEGTLTKAIDKSLTDKVLKDMAR